MGQRFESACTHIHGRTAGASAINRPYELLPSLPRLSIGVLAGCRVYARARLYAQVQHIVVDLEEPRSLRPTIGWPASGAMRHPAYQLLRIVLLRTPVNKGNGTALLPPKSN